MHWQPLLSIGAVSGARRSLEATPVIGEPWPLSPPADEKRAYFHSIGAWYRDFRKLNETEARDILAERRRVHQAEPFDWAGTLKAP